MANHFAIYNDDYSVQIDDTYRNLSLVATFEITTSQKFGNVYQYNYTSQFDSLAILAIRPKIINDDLYFTSTRDKQNYTILSSKNVTFVVYVFAQSSSQAHYGLVIQNAAGDIIFDALKKYMRVLNSVFVDSTALLPNAETSYSQEQYSQSKLLAFACSDYAYNYDVNVYQLNNNDYGGWQWDTATMCNVTNNNVVNVKAVTTYYVPLWGDLSIMPAMHNYSGGAFNTLIIDVTNY